MWKTEVCSYVCRLHGPRLYRNIGVCISALIWCWSPRGSTLLKHVHVCKATQTHTQVFISCVDTPPPSSASFSIINSPRSALSWFGAACPGSLIPPGVSHDSGGGPVFKTERWQTSTRWRVPSRLLLVQSWAVFVQHCSTSDRESLDLLGTRTK